MKKVVIAFAAAAVLVPSAATFAGRDAALERQVDLAMKAKRMEQARAAAGQTGQRLAGPTGPAGTAAPAGAGKQTRAGRSGPLDHP